MLEWRPVELAMESRRHGIRARVAKAPDGSDYVMWRDEHGWNVGHAATPNRITTPYPCEREYAMAGDAELVAKAWASGQGALLRLHDYRGVFTREDGSGDWVADAWECRCGAGEYDYDNIGEAHAGARAHWRKAVRVALEVSAE